MHVCENIGDTGSTRVCYIGFRGVGTKVKTGQVVECVYEARAVPKSNKSMTENMPTFGM